jgi:hypothetical protein
MAAREKRPLLISVFAILIFGVGILCLMAGTMFAMGKLDDYLGELGMTKEAAALLLIGIGTAEVAMAGGFWDGWKLAWYIGVVVLIALIVTDIIAATQTSTLFLVTVPLEVLILLYLFKPDVKAYFKHRSGMGRRTILFGYIIETHPCHQQRDPHKDRGRQSVLLPLHGRHRAQDAQAGQGAGLQGT